jgi:hypothetical protein
MSFHLTEPHSVSTMSELLLSNEPVSSFFPQVKSETNEAETTLRQVVGGRVLQSVISDREGLAQEVAEIVSLSIPLEEHD